jgi:hypothetical protein
MRLPPRLLPTLLAALACAALALPATPQITTGGLEGMVTDPQGKGLAGVQVTISGSALPDPRFASSSGGGTYIVDGLPEGSYQASFEREGYASRTEPATVNAGRTTTLNATLTPSVVREPPGD